MTALAPFPLQVWQEGSTENAIPANANTVNIQAVFGPALDFSDAAPSSPAAYDQYVIRTAWGGFAVGNIVIFVAGAWQAFASFNGLAKVINGVRYVLVAGVWHSMLTWVAVPATTSSAGTPGQVAYDTANLFFYVCTAANTWERTALTSDVTPPPPPPPPAPANLLLDFEGTTFEDKSTHALTISNHGSTLSSVQAKFGTQSMVPHSCIEVNDASLVPGTGDFMFEAWVYVTNNGGQQFVFDQRNPGGMCLYHTNGSFNFYDGNSGTNLAYTGGSTITTNTWHHVEVDRASGTIYIFLDGVLGGTVDKTGVAWTNPRWIIGAAQYTPIGVNQLLGYIDEVRIVIGEAIHTANFVPPTAPYTV